jgi:hypothetical protein
VTETARSQIGNGPFETPVKKFYPGELYSKTWRAPYTNGLTDVWRERCRGYWDRVEQRFGVVFSERRDAWTNDPELGPCVVTYATPIAIVKGERIPVGQTVRSDLVQ